MKADVDGLMGEAGAGVGGNSVSIISTCQARFSSRNFKRSACGKESVQIF
jgi:hypothetical protein